MDLNGIEIVDDNFTQPAQNPYEDRVTAILQKRAQPQELTPDQQYHYGQAAMYSAGGHNPQTYEQIIKAVQQPELDQQDRAYESYNRLYDMFEQKRAMGDKQAGAVGEALGKITSDPDAQGRLLEWLHNLPEKVDAGNPNKLLMLLARGKRELGIQTDFERGEEKRKAEIAKLNRIGTGSGGGQAMALWGDLQEMYPDADPMFLLRIAQNKVGTNLNADLNTGAITPMMGAPEALGGLSRGQKLGEQGAIIDTAAEIERQKGIGQAAGAAEGSLVKKEVNAPQIIGLIDSAEKILPYATSGGVGAAGAKVKGAVGVSDAATQADAQLDVISAALLNNVPRMEGPQSDADRISYERAAGDLGNRSKPVGDRAASLKIIKNLQQKYAQPGASNSGGWSIRKK